MPVHETGTGLHLLVSTNDSRKTNMFVVIVWNCDRLPRVRSMWSVSFGVWIRPEHTKRLVDK